MVIRLITYALMALKLNVVEAAFCFDDSVGHILVTLTNRSSFDIRKWSLRWDDGNWSGIPMTERDRAGSVTGSGCSSMGGFKLRLARTKDLLAPFEFVGEVHVLCAPGIPYCNFPVVVHSKTVSPKIAYVSGKLRCNCVRDHIGIGEASRENSTRSAMYSATIESLIELEDQNIFNKVLRQSIQRVCKL
jgi:hypothetical protein